MYIKNIHLHCMYIKCIGIASMEGRASGRLGAVTVLYVVTSHVVAVTFALVMAFAIRPGRWWDQANDDNNDAMKQQDQDVAFSDIFADFVR